MGVWVPINEIRYKSFDDALNHCCHAGNIPIERL